LEQAGPLNRAFDRATLLFFGGKYEEAVRLMDSVASVLDQAPGAAAGYAERATKAMAAWARQRSQLVAGADTIAFHTVVPRGRTGPLPLVIALHGAGADERAFLEAYGAGRLRELAEERGFILVTAFTNAWMRQPGAAFDAAVDSASGRHAVDSSRIYVIGHSLGAGATWTTARSRGDRIAAIACLAGGCGAPPATGAPPARMPPTLLYAGELDPLVAPSRLEAVVARGREAGYEIDFRVRPAAGHTLMVGAVLDEVVAWLLAKVKGEG
jgi:predicted esterase